MGSIGAMKEGSKDRYFQDDVEATAEARPRGHRGPRALQGQPLRESIYQLVGGLRRHGLRRLRATTRCARTRASCASRAQGLRESHVHDVIITKELPNYRVE
jgi:IMP dehydrogenase